MKALPFDCSHTDLWVSPSNWATTTAKSSLKKKWYVQCYFYDPQHADQYPKGFPFRRAINKGNYTLDARRDAAILLLDEIPKLFLEKGYNPITDKFMFGEVPAVSISRERHQPTYEVGPDTPFIEALEFGELQFKGADSTKDDLKNIMLHISTAIHLLKMEAIPIAQISRRHVKLIFDKLESTHGNFSGHKFNKYRAYFSIVYEMLFDYEAVETNVVKQVKKRDQERQAREGLTPAERRLINLHLKQNNPDFWLFMQIYFHSGGRIEEQLRVQIKDVDIEKQRYRTMIKKRKGYTWVWRVIKDIALPFWKIAIDSGQPDDFVFSKGLKPGPSKIRYEQITKRWRVHVKEKLGIKCDFSFLKHINLDEISEILSAKDAAQAAAHTSDRMVVEIYAFGEKERRNTRLKSVNNSFA